MQAEEERDDYLERRRDREQKSSFVIFRRRRSTEMVKKVSLGNQFITSTIEGHLKKTF